MAQITLRDYLQETEDAISSQRIDDALANCQYILAYFPDSLEAQRLLGEVYLAQGRLEEARQAFDWVLTNDPENVIAYCSRALVSDKMGDAETALDCYQQAYELSRGNSQIRQAFNELSVKTGQQGFMFSRAGLARLYMRGSLLTQAAQEWDAVLAVSPDRLDARTGLLETLWRQGIFDRVSQLAHQILQDVPGCLKALLLLAHATAPQDLLQSQELVKRAEALDPDLNMAQDLFADHLANHKGDPFFQLMKKEPAAFTANVVSVNANEAVQFSVPSDALAQWGAVESWNNESTLLKEKANEHVDLSVSQSGISLSGISQSGISLSGISQAGLGTGSGDQWRQNSASGLWNSLAPTQEPEVPQPEPWELLQDALNGMSTEGTQEKLPSHENVGQSQNWSEATSFEIPESAKRPTEEPNEPQIEQTVEPWVPTKKAEEPNATPAWLSALNQNERVQEPQSTKNVSQEPVVQEEPKVEKPVEEPLKQEEKEPSFSFDEDDEESFFGPDWLKSIGATTLGDSMEMPAIKMAQPPLEKEEPEEIISQPAQVEEVVEPAKSQTWLDELAPVAQAQVQDEAWNTLKQEDTLADLWPATENEQIVPEQPSWLSQITTTPVKEPQKETWQPAAEERSSISEQFEQNLVTTLEQLEQKLRSKGFIPLEPNSLSAIAQNQEPVSSEPSLSSAFAQLGNVQEYQQEYHDHQEYTKASQPLVEQPAYEEKEIATQQPGQTQEEPAEPEWMAALRALPVSSQSLPVIEQSVQQEPLVAEPQPVYEPEPVYEPVFTQPKTQPEPVVPVAPVVPFQVSTPEPVPVAQSRTESYVTPLQHVNPLLNSELEVTMRRPAVRLQPMQQRIPSTPLSNGTSIPKQRTNERSTKTNDGSLSHQDRLLKGYQAQLIGDYDSAMQEYRLIIRTAPELLGEVISNVRALLKIAPKYSAGYRVLGDAYMRQGEYLQAMEAYNKALTMAKKTK